MELRPPVKPRESRRSVMISARLRHGTAWSDARILNISSRGLLVRAQQSPRRGSYVELYKGQHRIIARVVWTQDERFGVHTQDWLPVDSITMGIEPPPAAAPAAGSVERRLRSREATAAERHEQSRRRSRAIEFLCIAAVGVAVAAFAFDAIGQTLARPLAEVSQRLVAAN